MKINNKNFKSKNEHIKNNKTRKKKNISGSENDFASYLSEITQNNVKKELDELILDIEKKGNNLKEFLSKKNIKEYKKAVKEFLTIIQNKYVEAAQTYNWDRNGNLKTYTIIKKINNELYKLQDLFFKEQAEELKIVQKIDQIRGLLLNLYS